MLEHTIYFGKTWYIFFLLTLSKGKKVNQLLPMQYIFLTVLSTSHGYLSLNKTEYSQMKKLQTQNSHFRRLKNVQTVDQKVNILLYTMFGAVLLLLMPLHGFSKDPEEQGTKHQWFVTAVKMSVFSN